MADLIVAPLALLLFFIFLGFLIFYVPEPDLIIVIAGVSFLALYDFWKSITGEGNEADRESGSED